MFGWIVRYADRGLLVGRHLRGEQHAILGEHDLQHVGHFKHSEYHGEHQRQTSRQRHDHGWR
ncbi:hypothetical protein [Branchiibius sp. NY16-3462-2]|uniref:hypothetical protein n=1 Tax=Branchiibius sp. NY16-3462-2 TaxID=1807500 RepID=UPI00079AB1AB|nr:hypothetical protein [Branchiibius sp. NY16-3462-2]KYH45199.1 hypothetical protein AZH51_15125 [Branchiibius sp. NY16-3462-2]